jgi:enoyl-CoA hydratase/carnithine racemase
MSDAAPLRIARDTAVATLVIDRPERRNAISLEMYEALPGLLAELDADPAVKVVVIRGAGRDAFAAGADISEFQTLRASADGARRYNASVLAAEHALAGLSKPTIAMVHGHCVGGGAGLAVACDLRFADDRARLAIPPAKLGLVYGFDSTRRLVALVGPARAKLILMSGDAIDARRAQALGLIDVLAAPDDLAAVTYEFAERLCTRAQFSVRAVKQIVGRIVAGQTEEDDAVRELRSASFDTEDYAEGVRAFLEKRPPAFTWQ